MLTASVGNERREKEALIRHSSVTHQGSSHVCWDGSRQLHVKSFGFSQKHQAVLRRKALLVFLVVHSLCGSGKQ